MKKNLFLICFAFPLVLLLSFSYLSAESTNTCNPSIKIINQDPYPAIPGSYVKVVFEVTNLGYCANGFAVKLNPEYPFSLDNNSSIISTISSNPYASGYKSSWIVPYKLRIASDAIDGDYSLKLAYHTGDSEIFTNYVEQGFNVTIKDSRTEFDAVIQEVSGSDVSIAIANVGKYTANSVVVRIPQQDYFAASGIDGQMVGNIESGDYTIVGFSVNKKSMQMQKTNSTRNYQSSPSDASNNLRFDIYYTDNLGERRVVNMALALTPSANSSSMPNFSGFSRAQNQSTSWYASWKVWSIILIILILGFIIYKKYFKNKLKHSSSQSPDWMKNAKEKEKKK
ncbi:MAG: hypothetical protein ACP5OG_01220 [Candidatus Nanoarchaeia archaeon]